MNQRIIQDIKSRVTRLDSPGNLSNLPTWLTEQAKQYRLRWLLAHTDSGVIWGEMREDTLYLSCEAFASTFRGVALDVDTLQQCRLFGKEGELLLWQGTTGWQAALRRDDVEDGTSVCYLDEDHLLWGNRKEGEQDGFLLLAEGREGIVHAPPLKNVPDSEEEARAALSVRHYLTENAETGMLRVAASRLVELLEPAKRACAEQGGEL